MLSEAEIYELLDKRVRDLPIVRYLDEVSLTR